ncbi:hypothetical protein, partial [Actinotalea sp. C106]|uniref:hypothetical protein n=1 Tax=Actinotalea sp. C106 TaxID=2908644 RepID=UPI0020292D01
ARRRPGLRRAASVGLAAAAVLGLGACSATNPITTTMNYDASDGVGAEVGDIRAGNLILLTESEGAAGTVIGWVSNDGTDRATVTLALDGTALGSPIRLAAGETVLLGPDRDRTVDVDAAPGAPGSLVEMTVAADAAGTTTIDIPILDGAFSEYTDLVPTGTD